MLFSEDQPIYGYPFSFPIPLLFDSLYSIVLFCLIIKTVYGRKDEMELKKLLQNGLSANALKVIAIIAMTIDHAAWLGYDYYPQDPGHALLHCIGRLTAPIMIYFVAEGYHYTHNFKKYASRMAILAIISHFAFCFFNGSDFNPFTNLIFNATSVIWPLFCGLILLKIWDMESLKKHLKCLITILICILTFTSDWSLAAPLAILMIGRNRDSFAKQMLWLMAMCSLYAVMIFLFADHIYGMVHLATWFSVPLLSLYNSKLGKPKWLGKFFYYYYPVHMILLGLINKYFF